MFFGIFLIIHGLAHIWYVVLSLELVEFQPEMGWTGYSWIFTDRLGERITPKIAAFEYNMATFLFVVSGVGLILILQSSWANTWTIIAAVLSTVTIIEFWDGKPQMLVQKGLLGVIINIGLIILS